jgi:hypothetical protein
MLTRRLRRLAWGLGCVLAGVLAGCIHEPQLQPRADAKSLAGDPSAAVAEAAGVRLIADGAAWNGDPSNLEGRLTPVAIWLENNSGRTLTIRYSSFDLQGGSRFQYAALGPVNMRNVAEAQPRCVTGYAPGYWSLGFGWGWGPFYGARYGYPWAAPWGPSPYYDPFYAPFYGPTPYVQCDKPLPTQDMVQRALPAGTLENGGSVSGFLYFQGVSARERQVTLQASLVDASTGQPFAQLAIPFQVHR